MFNITSLVLKPSLYNIIDNQKENLNNEMTIDINMRSGDKNKTEKFLKLGGILGSGAQCHVLKVLNDENLLVKVYNDKKILESIRPLLKTSHKNLEKLFEIIVYEGNESAIIVERLDYTLLNLNPKVDNNTIFRVAKDIESGIDYLHKEVKVAHLDIKLDNLMYSTKDDNYKLIDFGFIEPEKNFGSYPLIGNKFITPVRLFKDSLDWGYYVDHWQLGVVLHLLKEDKHLAQELFDSEISEVEFNTDECIAFIMTSYNNFLKKVSESSDAEDLKIYDLILNFLKVGF